MVKGTLGMPLSAEMARHDSRNVAVRHCAEGFRHRPPRKTNPVGWQTARVGCCSAISIAVDRGLRLDKARSGEVQS
jgi:hypothetical protein